MKTSAGSFILGGREKKVKSFPLRKKEESLKYTNKGFSDYNRSVFFSIHFTIEVIFTIPTSYFERISYIQQFC